MRRKRSSIFLPTIYDIRLSPILYEGLGQREQLTTMTDIETVAGYPNVISGV